MVKNITLEEVKELKILKKNNKLKVTIGKDGKKYYFKKGKRVKNPKKTKKSKRK